MRYFIVLIGMPFLQMLTAHLFRIFLPETDSFVMTYCQIFLQQLIAICIPVLILFPKNKYFPKQEFLVSKPGFYFRCAFLGILLQFIGMAVNFPISAILQQFGFHLPASFSNAECVLEFVLQTAVICLTPAIFEEILFRRVIYQSLEGYSQKTVIVLSSLFFAMAHFDFHNFAATFTVGLSLGILRQRGAPLILCVMTHFFVNFTATLLNHMLEIPFLASLMDRYFVLIVFLATVLLIAVFPKKFSLDTSDTSLEITESKPWTNILRQPLFYIYIAIFFILGVNQL